MQHNLLRPSGSQWWSLLDPGEITLASKTALFVKVWLILMVLISSLFLVVNISATDQRQARLAQLSNFSINLAREQFETRLRDIHQDIETLAESLALRRFANNPSRGHLDAVGRRFFTFMEDHENEYDQVRLLTPQGQEWVRVDLRSYGPQRISDNELQDKSERYYVRESAAMAPGEIYLSRLDLNIEAGQIERPFKPMLRLATVINSQEGIRTALLVLNYRAENLLEIYDPGDLEAAIEFWVLNADGYWLQHPDQSRRWGFMLADRPAIHASMPALADTLYTERAGQVTTADGLATFTTITPSEVIPRITQGAGQESELKIVAWVPREAWSEWIFQRHHLLEWFLYGLALASSALLAWGIVAYRVSYVVALRELQDAATRDSLTGAANRSLLMDRAKTAIARIQREQGQIAVLFIDLDHFKAVNDKHGHDAGDVCLIEVARRIERNIRASDTLARLGGDEFLVMLEREDKPEIAGRIAAKILRDIQQPVAFRDLTLQLDATIGIAFYPHGTASFEEVIVAADRAMYQGKRLQRGTISFA